MSERRYRRPSFQAPAALEALGERVDPIGQVHAAHESAAVLLHAGRAGDDPAVVERLVALVDEIWLICGRPVRRGRCRGRYTGYTCCSSG